MIEITDTATIAPEKQCLHRIGFNVCDSERAVCGPSAVRVGYGEIRHAVFQVSVTLIYGKASWRTVEIEARAWGIAERRP